MRYSCNDIFMVRTPSLPASVFSDFVQFEGNDVENFLQQTPFRDFMDKSILLSSRELYNAKKRNLQSSTKKSKARNLARIKFLIRACTRPTPYGLFAGAALGEFCENPNIEPLYEVFQVVNEEKIPCWPGPMTVEEYWNGTCKPENLHISSSWCYGNAGVMRGLQKVAGYMGWKEKEQAHVETMIRFFSQNIKTYDLYSPSLCHGFSSLVAIQMCAYSSYRNPKLLTNLERHIQKMIAGYRKNNENELNLTDIRNKSILIEGHLNDLSILTGSVGIAITLLSLKRTTKTGKLLMID